MTTQVDVSSGAEQPRDLVSLNPEDGLFLRAEHLTTIQDYARAITMAVGQAAGTGVVWGLDLRVDEKAAQASLPRAWPSTARDVRCSRTRP